MYKYYCLAWRLSLILDSLNVSSICMMFPGRVLYVRAPFILKFPWHLAVFSREGRSKLWFLLF